MSVAQEPEYDDDETPEVEVVSLGEQAPPRTEIVQRNSAADSAVEAAAMQALAEPGIPGRDEVLSLALQARLFAGSDLAPEAIRGKPYNAWMILMTGRALKIDPTAALRKVYVVDGQPSLAPQLTIALVRRQGLGSIRPHPDNNDEWAAAVALDPRGREMGPPSVFTWQDAQLAGLVDPQCSPDHHEIRQITRYKRGGGTYNVTGCECKHNWKSYPRRMLWWRAAGYCADDYFPEVSMGLYSPDELGALTDEDGDPIDPATVELPQGYEQAGDGRDTRVDERADPADLWSLQERIAALPDDVRAELRKRWLENDRLTHPVKLAPGPLRIAQSMVSGFESQAKQSGWQPEPALEAVRRQIAERVVSWMTPAATDEAPTAPGAPSEDESDGSSADEPEAPTEPQGGAASEMIHEAETLSTLADHADVVALVQKMDRDECERQLAARGLDVDGGVRALRERLAARLVEEASQ